MPSRRTMIRLVLSHAGMAASGVGLIAAAAMVTGSAPVEAQGDAAPADGLLVIPGPDGGLVSLRSGPSVDQPAVASVGAYEMVMPLGAAHFDGATRWLPVKTAANQVGWIAEPYLAAVGASPPVASPEPEVALAAPPPPPLPAAEAAPPASSASLPVTAEAPPATPPSTVALAPVRMEASASEATTSQVPAQSGKPLEIEAKLKYPEARGRHQEITIWVTREGVPVSGALVTIFTEDDEDEPMRVLEPTNIEGRTRREFAIGREKGSIELVVSAVSPDGGKGRTTASYFRR